MVDNPKISLGGKEPQDNNQGQGNSNSEPKWIVCPPNEQPNREGFTAYRVLGSRFELPNNFEIIEPVGSGAYGVVVAVKDKSAED